MKKLASLLTDERLTDLCPPMQITNMTIAINIVDLFSSVIVDHKLQM